MRGLFADDAVIRRVDGEAVLLLGGGRALLMQLAHPSVAAGVAAHSDFAADPFRRLFRTLDATYAIVFGTEDEALATAAAVRAVHERVSGPGYRASDPELLMWVHATLVDTALRLYRRLIAPLSWDDAEQYYQQSTVLAELLGCPREHQPPDLAAFRTYMREMVGTIEVSDTAKRLARDVLRPSVPLVAEPAFGMVRLLTAGTLPRPLRRQYGLTWGRPQKAALVYATEAARRVLPLVPPTLRRMQPAA